MHRSVLFSATVSLALLSSGCPALMTAALEGSEVEDHEPRPPTPKATALPAATPTPAPTPVPTAALDSATYTLVIGEAISATNPRLSRPTSIISKGTYVAMKFETSAESFGMDGVDVTLYVLEGGSRSVATHRRSPFKPSDDVLYKSWQIKQKGSFVIEVQSPDGRLLATGTFKVV